MKMPSCLAVICVTLLCGCVLRGAHASPAALPANHKKGERVSPGTTRTRPFPDALGRLSKSITTNPENTP